MKEKISRNKNERKMSNVQKLERGPVILKVSIKEILSCSGRR